MFGKSKLLLCLAFALALAGCGDPKLDYSSEEAAKASQAKVLESLSAEKKREFQEAGQRVVWSLLGTGSIADAEKAIKEKLHGKTADEVIAMAAEIEKEEQKKKDNPAPAKAKPNSPFGGLLPPPSPSAPSLPPPPKSPPSAPLLPPSPKSPPPAPLLPPSPKSLQITPPPPPTSAFFAGGKTPDASLIPGNKPDIAGIAIGSMLNPDLISKINPAYEFNKYRGGDGREAGVSARTGHDQLEVMWNDVGLVWHVGRHLNLEESERFMIDVLKTSLQEKYGPPSYAQKNRLIWAYDREGNLFSGSDASSLCEWGYGSGAPSNFKPNCGYKIVVAIGTDSRVQGAVTDYYVAITYVKPVFDELVFKKKETELARQQKLEEDTRRAQQNKPRL
jgi:hypothetical protein